MFDRKTHWDKVYQNKSSLDVSWYQKEPLLSLELIRGAQLAHDEPIIDVGGGASVLVDYLCREGFTNLAVLDISEKALSCAKQRLGDLAQDIEWYESDITQFEAPHPFSLWHDRAVFHFLTDASDRKAYVKVLKQTLLPSGCLIIAAFAIGGPEKCSGLDTVQYDSAKITAELGDEFTLVETRNELHITPTNHAQKFMYFRFIRAQQSEHQNKN